jgi:hypothetical protein
MSFCPDKPILAGFLESFAPYPFLALAGRHDGDVISLTRLPVNDPNPHAVRMWCGVRAGCCLKKRGFRDTTKGYLVLWCTMPCAHGGQCAGLYPILRSQKTTCQVCRDFRYLHMGVVTAPVCNKNLRIELMFFLLFYSQDRILVSHKGDLRSCPCCVVWPCPYSIVDKFFCHNHIRKVVRSIEVPVIRRPE